MKNEEKPSKNNSSTENVDHNNGTHTRTKDFQRDGSLSRLKTQTTTTTQLISKHFYLKSSSQVDGSVTLKLVLVAPLDREKQSKHLLSLQAFDGGSPPRNGSLLIRVSVLDVNDNAPVFSQVSVFYRRCSSTLPSFATFLA